MMIPLQLPKISLNLQSILPLSDHLISQYLFQAVRFPDIKLLELIIKIKPNLNVLDDFGRTPLMYGVIAGHEKIVKLLLRNNVNIEISEKSGKNVLHFAALYDRCKIIKILCSNAV